MKNKEYLNASDIAAEIEALYQKAQEQEKIINDLVIIVNKLVEWKKLSHPSPIE